LKKGISKLNDRSKTRVVSIANQKGGVGKTTTAINLATALVSIGNRVLIIDLDAQGNASTGLGIPVEDRQLSTYDVIVDNSDLRSIIKNSLVDGLFIAPATTDLSSADVDLVSNDKRTMVLKHSIVKLLESNSNYDYILIDCPPALSLLTINAFVACETVLVPLQAEFFALEGLSQLMTTIKEVRGTLNKNIRIQGIVLTMYDKRNNLSVQIEEDVREHLGKLVYETVIPRNVRLSEAPSFSLPALLYDRKCAGSIAYKKLAAEFLERESKL
tara:strand:- start:1437 stop:2252 length:816 start_codon:yes stop_codon:yes gene_type:complete